MTPTPDGRFTQTVHFRDRELRMMQGLVETPSTTDVRLLNWYLGGLGQIGSLDWIGRTIPGRNRTRISFLTGFAGEMKGAVSIDVGQDDVTTALQAVHNAANEHLVVFDKDGKSYGSTGAWTDAATESADAELDRAILDTFKQSGIVDGLTLESGSASYYASAVPISLRGGGELSLYAGVAKRLDSLEAPFRTNLYATLGMVLLTWLFTLPVAVMVARRVARPLLNLCTLRKRRSS